MTAKQKQCKRNKAAKINNGLLALAKAFEKDMGVNLPILKNSRKTRRLLTTQEAAERLGRKKHTLENWRTTNSEGPAYHKVGGRVLYDSRDITKYLKDRKFKNTSSYFASPSNDGAKQ